MLQGNRAYWTLEAVVFLPTACMAPRKLLSPSESQLLPLLRGNGSTRTSPSSLPVLTFAGWASKCRILRMDRKFEKRFTRPPKLGKINTPAALSGWHALMECALPAFSAPSAHPWSMHCLHITVPRGTSQTRERLSSAPPQLSPPLWGRRSKLVLYKSSPDEAGGQPGLSRGPST